MEGNMFSNFLIWLSGLTPKNQLSDIEKDRLKSLGLVNFLSSLLFIASILYITESIYGLSFILIIPIFILGFYFSLIEKIIGSFSYTEKGIKRAFAIIFRGVISILIAILVSTILQLSIFKDEINNYFIQSEEKNIENQFLSNSKLNQDLYYKRIVSLDDRLRRLKSERDMEIAGASSHGTPAGIGRLAKKLSFEIANIESEISRLNDEMISNEKDLQRNAQELKLNKKPLNKYDIIAKTVGLSNLIEQSSTVKLLSAAITVLFICIELTPVILLLTLYNGTYKNQQFIDLDAVHSHKMEDQNVTKLIQPNDDVNQTTACQNLKTGNADPSFESYFLEIKETLESHAKLADMKASRSLDKGLFYASFGFLFFLTSILSWQIVLWLNNYKLENGMMAGILSCGFLFVFVEFISAWFLKQYRHFVDTSTYLIKVKSTIDRYYLSYLLIKDNNTDDDQQMLKHLPDLLALLKENINWPNTLSYENKNTSYAKEHIESLAGIKEMMKEYSKKE